MFSEDGWEAGTLYVIGGKTNMDTMSNAPFTVLGLTAVRGRKAGTLQNTYTRVVETFEQAESVAASLTTMNYFDTIRVENKDGNSVLTYTRDDRSAGHYQKGF